MNSNEDDILLIKKYLGGELNAKAMHQLERRALDDPFLMDALEGYENATADQQYNLDELSARLVKRTAAKRRTIIPWSVAGIAASVLIVCSAGIFWLTRRQTAKVNKNVPKQIIAATAARGPEVVPGTSAPAKAVYAKIAEPQKKPAKSTHQAFAVSNMIAETRVSGVTKPVKPGITDSVKKDTTPLNEMIVMDYTAKNHIVDTLAYKADKQSYTYKKNAYTSLTTPKAPKLAKFSAAKSNVQLLRDQAEGATDNNEPSPSPPKDVTLNGVTIAATSPAGVPINPYRESSKDIIQGTVISSENGRPVQGANVRVAGNKLGTMTDSNGRFWLPADSDKAMLVVGGVGYRTSKVVTSTKDSAKTIPLSSKAQSLAEVVITPRAATKQLGNTRAAHPEAGWRKFRAYLNKNAVSPNGKPGIVRLTMVIGSDGTLSDIKITGGVSPATDARAIALLKNGPKWTGNLNGRPENVNLKIHFR